MPFYRYTMFMQFNNAAPPAGFSESWENEASTDANARNTMQTLIQARRSVLSSSWKIVGGRISKLRVGTCGSPPVQCIQQSLIQPLVCQVSNDGALGVSDTPWAAVLIDVMKFANDNFPSSRPRAQQMRGIPDTWWSNAALDIPLADQAAVTQFFQYITQVVAGSFGGGQVRILSNALHFTRYRSICLRRISSRRIGRPFGLLRGRQSREEPES